MFRHKSYFEPNYGIGLGDIRKRICSVVEFVSLGEDAVTGTGPQRRDDVKIVLLHSDVGELTGGDADTEKDSRGMGVNHHGPASHEQRRQIGSRVR
jgi:hypothetical protein